MPPTEVPPWRRTARLRCPPSGCAADPGKGNRIGAPGRVLGEVSMEEIDGFTAFAVSRRGSLVQLGWAMTGDRHLAEDLAQATLDRLWRRWPQISAESNVWPYAQRTLMSISATWWRRRWRSEYPVGSLPDVPSGRDLADEQDTRQIVHGWLRGLPRRQRAVIVLRFLADLSVEQTAQVLDCSTGTVKSQTSKALAGLRGRIESMKEGELL